MKQVQKWIICLMGVVLCHKAIWANPSFESVRGGIQVGYALIDSTVHYARTQAPNASDMSDISGRGTIGGITLDWCRILGNSDMLLGVEGSLNFTKAIGRKSTKGTFFDPTPGASWETTVEFSRSIYLTMKVGYMAKGAALAYFKVGPSRSRWRSLSTNTFTNTKSVSAANGLGLILGVGAEFPLSDRISWGGEYNYRRPKNLSHNITQPNGLTIRSVDVAPTSHAIMFRLNYRFCAPDYAETPPEKKRKRKRSRNPQ
jgi:opacity protein-like surface antigen